MVKLGGNTSKSLRTRTALAEHGVQIHTYIVILILYDCYSLFLRLYIDWPPILTRRQNCHRGAFLSPRWQFCDHQSGCSATASAAAARAA